MCHQAIAIYTPKSCGRTSNCSYGVISMITSAHIALHRGYVERCSRIETEELRWTVTDLWSAVHPRADRSRVANCEVPEVVKDAIEIHCAAANNLWLSIHQSCETKTSGFSYGIISRIPSCSAPAGWSSLWHRPTCSCLRRDYCELPGQIYGAITESETGTI